MTALAQFQFPATGQAVRTVDVDGTPWFVAADVCAVLGIANSRDALARLDSDEKGVGTTDTLGGPQVVSIVSEPGLYGLTWTSRKAEAGVLRRWVKHEVLPALRRTGSYSVASAQTQLSPRELAQLIIAEADRADAAEARAAELAPAADAWQVLASGDGDYSVADAAKILSRDPAIKIGRNRLFGILHEQGWAYVQRADHRYRAMQTAVERGRLSELPQSHYHPRTGELVLDPPQVRVTPKGIADLRTLLGGTVPLAITSDSEGL